MNSMEGVWHIVRAQEMSVVLSLVPTDRQEYGGGTFTVSRGILIVPGWQTEFELFAHMYKLGDSTLNPRFPTLFENSEDLVTVAYLSHAATLG